MNQMKEKKIRLRNKPTKKKKEENNYIMKAKDDYNVTGT